MMVNLQLAGQQFRSFRISMRLTSRSKGQTGMTRATAIQFLELPIDQRNFEKKELDKAFRQKARILHPDSPTGNGLKYIIFIGVIRTIDFNIHSRIDSLIICSILNSPGTIVPSGEIPCLNGC